VFDPDTPDDGIAARLLTLPATRVACGAARGSGALVSVVEQAAGCIDIAAASCIKPRP
jgi:hypothetical protein